jgi:CheY-like chemotaxis protein
MIIDLMSENEEDEKATIVLDITDIKKQMQTEEIIDSDDPTLEFSVIDEESGSLTGLNQDRIYCFNYETDYFTEEAFQNFTIVSAIGDLNAALSDNNIDIIILNYSQYPKVANIISKQVKAKFPKVKTLILAKNLSASKAQAHAKTESGADGYLNIPFTDEELNQKVLEVSNK